MDLIPQNSCNLVKFTLLVIYLLTPKILFTLKFSQYYLLTRGVLNSLRYLFQNTLRYLTCTIFNKSIFFLPLLGGYCFSKGEQYNKHKGFLV